MKNLLRAMFLLAAAIVPSGVFATTYIENKTQGNVIVQIGYGSGVPKRKILQPKESMEISPDNPKSVRIVLKDKGRTEAHDISTEYEELTMIMKAMGESVGTLGIQGHNQYTKDFTEPLDRGWVQ
jgi:hypothetical protein